MGRFILFALASALVGFSSAFLPSPSVADTNFGNYIRSDPSGTDKDPVNVLYTINGSLSNTLMHFADHVGWYDDGGSTMYFQDSGSWQAHDAQKASWCGACERNHTRFNHHDTLGFAGYDDFTMGAAHYEILAWCGHSSRSFNSPRDAIQTAFTNGGHNVVWYYQGNTASSTQCDGYNLGGDGWLIRAEIQ